MRLSSRIGIQRIEGAAVARRSKGDRIDGLLLLDKPAGDSSNRVLQQVRRAYGAAKAGHTGTLDPLASGLLPVCFGDATKFAQRWLDSAKSYRFTVELGVTTSTGDAEGDRIAVRPVEVAPHALVATVASMVGSQLQVPPLHSALKHQGRPLYEYARAGVEVAREARRIEVFRLEILGVALPRVDMVVDCSKGTYVRVLAETLGERLGCGGHVAALRRLRVGAFDVAGAVGLDEVLAASDERRLGLLLPVEALVADLPRCDVGELACEVLAHGQAVDAGGAGALALFGPGGRFIGVGEGREGRVRPVRMLASSG